jgi:hypothetical protein
MTLLYPDTRTLEECKYVADTNNEQYLFQTHQ